MGSIYRIIRRCLIAAMATLTVLTLAACVSGGRGEALLTEGLGGRLSAAAQMDAEGTLYYLSRQDEGWREVSDLLSALRGKPCDPPEGTAEQRFQLSLTDGELHELAFTPGAKTGEHYAALDGAWLRLRVKEAPGEALAGLLRQFCPRPARLTPANDGELTENSDALTAEMEYPDYDGEHLRVYAVLANHTEQEIAYDSSWPFEFQYLGEWYRLPPKDGTGYNSLMLWVPALDRAADPDGLNGVDMESIPGLYRFRVSYSIRRPKAKQVYDQVTYATFRVAEEAVRTAYVPLAQQSLDAATAEAQGCRVVTGGEAGPDPLVEGFIEKARLGIPCELRLVYPAEGKACHVSCLYDHRFGSYFLAETFQNGVTETAYYPYLALSADRESVVLSTFPAPALAGWEGMPATEADLLTLVGVSGSEAETLGKMMDAALDHYQDMTLQSVYLPETGDMLRINYSRRTEEYSLRLGSVDYPERWPAGGPRPMHLADLGEGRVLLTLRSPEGERRELMMKLVSGTLIPWVKDTGGDAWAWYFDALAVLGGVTVTYQNGGYVLSLPAEYAKQLYVHIPSEEGPLFQVFDRASMERSGGTGLKYHIEQQDGWLFSIWHVDADGWGQWVVAGGSGNAAYPFAVDGEGGFYVYDRPSWETYFPESSGDPDWESEDDYRRYLTLIAALRRFRVEERFAGDNGLTACGFTEAQRFLCFAAYGQEYDFTIRWGEGKPYGGAEEGLSPRVPRLDAELLRDLLWETDYSEIEACPLPEGEMPMVFERSDGAALRFWRGSELAVLTSPGGETRYFLAASEDACAGNLAFEILRTLMVSYPRAALEVLDKPTLPELADGCTDILIATYLGSRMTLTAAGECREDDFIVKYALKGTTEAGPITVYTDVVSVYGYLTGFLRYEPGQDYLLLLERRRSVFYDADHYLLPYAEPFLPLTAPGGASVYGEAPEADSDGLRADSTEEEIVAWFQKHIDESTAERREFTGTDFIRASSIEEAREAAPFVLLVEPTAKNIAGTDREVFECRVKAVIKGDLGSLRDRIYVIFFPGAAEVGEEYYVCVAQVSPPDSLLFVPISKEYSVYR